jgi:phosphatidylglycerol:prolipoprotein diacylglycerol transferase
MFPVAVKRMAPIATINPIAFSLGPLQVHWYGIIIGTAALIGLWLAIREGKRHGLDSEIFFDLMIWVIPAAILGARLYYVLFEWDWYGSHPVDILAVWKGGLAIHGGLIGAFTAAWWFVRKRGLSFLQIADICAPSIILGQAIGRWGNFVNQEAHGGVVSRSFLENLHLPVWIIDQMQIGGFYYHPTFLYESVWNLLGFALLLLLRRFVPVRRGEIFFGYLFWYSLGRFFIEGLRTDSLTFAGPAWLGHLLSFFWSPMRLLFASGPDVEGVRTAQLVSLFTMAAALFFFMLRRAKGWADPYGRTEEVVKQREKEAPAQ